MSYSCTVKADISLDAILAGLTNSKGSSNTFDHNGYSYMIERGRENADGAITGNILKFVAENRVQRSGSLRIEPNGAITRPAYMRKAAYSKGFSAIADNYPAFSKDMDGQELPNPLYPDFCGSYTENGILEGEIATINNSTTQRQQYSANN